MTKKLSKRLLELLEEKAKSFGSKDYDLGFEVVVSFTASGDDKTFEFDDEQDAKEFSDYAERQDGVYRADISETYYE